MVPTTRKKAVDVFNQLRGSDEDQLTYGGNFYYVLYEDVQETGWKWNAAGGHGFFILHYCMASLTCRSSSTESARYMDDWFYPCLCSHAGLWRSATEKSGCTL